MKKLLLLLLAAPALLSAQTLEYPETRKNDVVEDYHGTRVPDPYRWLEDQNGAETAAWVKAENAVTFRYLESLPARGEIRKRLTELWNYSRYSTPFHEGGRYFFYKNSGLQNQSVLYVQESLRDRARVLLDPNLLSSDGTVALASVAVSPDGRWLGYATATSGSDWNQLHIRDIATGRDLDDRIEWVKFSGMSWTRDGLGFFYSRYPEPSATEKLKATLSNQALYYHVLGTPQSRDRLIFSRPESPSSLINGYTSEDGRYLFISIRENTDPKNRLYYVDLENPMQPELDGAVVKLIDTYDSGYTVIDNDGPVLYLVTNKNAPRQKVISLDTRRPSEWKTIVSESAEPIESVSVIGNRLVARYLQDAHTSVRIFSKRGRFLGELSLPTMGSVSSISGKKNSNELFYSFTSFLYPSTVFRADVVTRKSEIFRKADIGFDPQQYEATQIFYTSRDGTRVPMFIVHRKGLRKNGQNPTYMYGYGGFDISMTPFFSVANLVWLELGGVFAMPNLRGGGEYGEAWHRAGTKQYKQNVFDDLIAAGEYLIREGYTTPARLAIGGGSNGGLLAGAALTQRPDLFAAAFPDVGVLDMLRFHKFTIGWAWTGDYGSSDNAEDFKYLYKYSPLHNVKPGVCYPATMISTADHDDRVVPAHSFKFAATLQAAQGCAKPVIIRIETRAGHGAGTPISKTIEQYADKWAFALYNMGLRPSVP